MRPQKDDLTNSNVGQKLKSTDLRRNLYVSLWMGLTLYTFFLSPGGSIDTAAQDNMLIKTLLSTPFDGTISPVFVALFNSLGIIPAVYASLLLPGAKNQRLPALPFIISSFALGFFGIGPYLAFREESNESSQSIFESKFTSVGLLLFSIYLLYYVSQSSHSVGTEITEYVEMFSKQRLVHISSIDFTILSLSMWDPMSEDMKRRNWSGASATLFSSIPVLGPVLYLILRPPLPKESI